MKKLSLIVCSILLSYHVFASHIVGGEMIYQFVSANATAGTKKYTITLFLFRDQDCTGCAAMPTNVYIGIYNNDTKAEFPNGGSSYFDVRKDNELPVSRNPDPPCITNSPALSYNYASYTFTVDLPDNKTGYTAAYQTCCRVAPLENVINNISAGGGGGSGTGSTYACVIPGTDQLGAAGFNNSPQFAKSISVICQNRKFSLDFGATDVDGDKLVYSFTPAYNGGRTTNSTNINPDPPPYSSVPYTNGFAANDPLGSSVTINASTGIISGTAPPVGEYVVAVNIDEFRNGALIGTHKKDFIVNVANCDFAGASLEPSYITCNDGTYTFKNLNSSPLNKTYLWDFGDGTTSTDPEPVHKYAAAGSYTITLYVNKGQTCGDFTTSVINVYPGFKPDFNFTGICLNKPTNFFDKTTGGDGGAVNSWKWDFGDASSTTDVSTVKDPTYTYKQMGTNNVKLVVTNVKGCLDSITKPITIIDKPPLKVAFKDTLMCNGDAMQLQAIGDGNFSWTPLTNIINANTATPTVSPSVTTKYIVQLDDNGCINRDSVNVRVVNFVTLQAWNDTTICSTDTAFLGATTNGLSYAWSPAGSVNHPDSLYTIARPANTTTYTITAHIGHCVATDDMVVKTAPYPVANAGADTTICYLNTTQLNGSLGSGTFVWSPANLLTNPASLTPVTEPLKNTTKFILTVKDNTGCPKPSSDTVIVNVLPKIVASAGHDTAVVVGQPVQFLATGGTRYLWTPATYLNATDTASPIAIFDNNVESIRYTVYVRNEANCIDSAFITVRIFKTAPQVFVPDAFTPNGDGKNDVFRPIAAGIAKMDYFRVYNRWGQLVFSSTTNGAGWDGKINGRDQPTGTFAWLVKGTDYLGKIFFAKGTVTLVR